VSGLPPAPLLPEERQRSERLTGRIVAEATAAGLLPFDRFVDLSLYDPADGYYTQPGLRLGPSGDFYTAANLGPLFGRTLARRIQLEYQRLGAPRSFEVQEAGVGEGTLTAQLQEEFQRLAPAGPSGTQVLIDVPGPRLIALGEAWSGRDAPNWNVRVSAGLGDRGPFQGIVLANELLDALPFRRVIRREGAWRELGVHAAQGRLTWGEGALCRPVPPPALPEAPEGAVLEISEAAEGWIRQVADLLVDGALLVLDYGGTEAEGLGTGSRGTLSTVRGHRGGFDPFEAPGTCDLSAFVDFTRIRAAAQRAGLQEVRYGRQAEVLGAWGFEAILQDALQGSGGGEADVRLRLAAKNLLFGFEGFQVLELRPRSAASAT
jgi:SAM-dependent MidA family methyltransferase